jgi:glycosyltransferase involved in cell wall biosynthesis
MKTSPLISCLCITHNNPKQLQLVINCFNAQTYANKELMVLFEGDNTYVKGLSNHNRNKDIYFVEVPANPKLTLGELRNIAVEQCNGEYFCQWDDDDWYANNRLQVQMDAIRQSCKPASMLLYWLMYDNVNKSAYLSPFRLWEGSILCKKSIITPECNYASLIKGEDTILLGNLLNSNSIFPVINPSLYIYVFHGKNTWDHNHFNLYYNRGKQLSDRAGGLIEEILNGQYSVEESTALLNQPTFLEEIEFRFELIDRYSLRMV